MLASAASSCSFCALSWSWLCLQQVVLGLEAGVQLFTLGNVVEGVNEAAHAAVARVHGGTRKADVHQRAVLAPSPHMDIAQRLAGQRALEQSLDFGALVWGHQLVGQAHGFLGGVAEYVLRTAAPKHHAGVRRGADDRCRHRIEYGSQRRLGLTLGLQQALALGDVLVDRDPAAVGGRPARDLHGSPAPQRIGLDRELGHRSAAFLAIGLRIGAGVNAVGDTVLHHLVDGGARLGQLGRQAVHVGVALVAHHQPLLGVHHAHAVRHVGEHHVDTHVLPAQLCLALLQGIMPDPQVTFGITRRQAAQERGHTGRDHHQRCRARHHDRKRGAAHVPRGDNDGGIRNDSDGPNACQMQTANGQCHQSRSDPDRRAARQLPIGKQRQAAEAHSQDVDGHREQGVAMQRARQAQGLQSNDVRHDHAGTDHSATGRCVPAPVRCHQRETGGGGNRRNEQGRCDHDGIVAGGCTPVVGADRQEVRGPDACRGAGSGQEQPGRAPPALQLACACVRLRAR